MYILCMYTSLICLIRNDFLVMAGLEVGFEKKDVDWLEREG